MRFDAFINESPDVKKQWVEYAKTNPMINAAIDVLNKIHKNGGKAWIVGGAVRDVVMGVKPKDIDIATNMDMSKLDDLFKTYDIGKSRDMGIIVINHKGFQFEVAQLRGETYQRPKTVRKIIE